MGTFLEELADAVIAVGWIITVIFAIVSWLVGWWALGAAGVVLMSIITAVVNAYRH